VKTDTAGDWQAFCASTFSAAIRPVLPKNCLPPFLPDPTAYRAVKLIALGKGAAAMARTVEQCWPDVTITGIAICRDGYGVQCDRVDVIESAHPIPDERSVAAAERALKVAADTKPEELLLVLLSGGGSSLACLPSDGITLEAKKQLISSLMRAGADISELNTVRKHLSAIKGGRLAAAAGNAGHIVTLAISDVVGDDPGLIASGPTQPDTSTWQDAQEILDRYGLERPPRWADDCAWVENNRSSFQIVAKGGDMLRAAERYGNAFGFDVRNIGNDVVGEARDVAEKHAAIARSYLKKDMDKPVLLLSGGELTATVCGTGQGGANQEYVLALAAAFGSDDRLYAFAADTDGMDGVGGAAGGISTPQNRKLAIEKAVVPEAMLAENDSLQYFKILDSSFTVEPTMTNVNDFRMIAIKPQGLTAL